EGGGAGGGEVALGVGDGAVAQGDRVRPVVRPVPGPAGGGEAVDCGDRGGVLVRVERHPDDRQRQAVAVPRDGDVADVDGRDVHLAVVGVDDRDGVLGGAGLGDVGGVDRGAGADRVVTADVHGKAGGDGGVDVARRVADGAGVERDAVVAVVLLAPRPAGRADQVGDADVGPAGRRV